MLAFVNYEIREPADLRELIEIQSSLRKASSSLCGSCVFESIDDTHRRAIVWLPRSVPGDLFKTVATRLAVPVDFLIEKCPGPAVTFRIRPRPLATAVA